MIFHPFYVFYRNEYGEFLVIMAAGSEHEGRDIDDAIEDQISPLCPFPVSYTATLPRFSPTLSPSLPLYTLAMDTVNEAMEALKKLALKGKNNKGLTERMDSLTTTLRLLVLGIHPKKISFTNLHTRRTFPSTLTPKYSKSSSRQSGNRLSRYTRSSHYRPSNSLPRSFRFCSTRR